MIAAAPTDDAKKDEAAQAVAAAKAEAARIEKAAADLEAASRGTDSAAMAAAAKAFDDSFGPVSVDGAPAPDERAPDGQDPAGQQPSPLQKVFENKTGKDLATAFPDVSIESFRQAFAQDKTAQEEIERKKLSLEGFNFGTGLAANFDMHRGSRVKSASIRNGLVSVDEEGDAQLGLLLETHYFFGASKPRLWGTGPFVAVKIGENDVIDAAGFGWMIGLRRKIEDENSFNIGVGVMVDPDAEVLADGFTPNQAPPAGATDVATKKEERFSFAIVFSYTF